MSIRCGGEPKILQECQAGNLANFGTLYDLYADKIYKFIYYRTHHKETAEDLTSQTFFKALSRIDSYNTDKGSFSSWIYKIARNAVIDHYRTQKSNIDIDNIWDLSGDEDIEKEIDTKDKLERVKDYLKNLNSEQRDIILMRVWDQMSYQEISEVLGKSESSCKMAFSRTMAKLRQDIPYALGLIMLLKI